MGPYHLLFMINLFLATGFEEIEALGTADILRRAGLNLQLVSVTGDLTVAGAHGMNIVADALFEDVDFFEADMLILPGGMPGAANLAANSDLCERLRDHVYLGRPVAAICAAPFVLGRLGLLDGKRATCYPGFEETLEGATYTGDLWTIDGNIITGEGPAAAFPYAYSLLALLVSEEKAAEVAEGMRYLHLMEARML